MMTRKSVHLDAWREPSSEVLIRIETWIPLSQVIGQFIEPDKNLLLVWNYIKRIGIQSTLYKIYCRLKETRRNQKVAAIGTGLVVESPTSTVSRGDRVIFFATNHPQKPTYICVNLAFVARYSEKISECSGVFDPIKDFPADLRAYVGWSRYSGVILDTVKIQKALNLLAKHLNIASESLQTSPTSSPAYTDHTVDKNAYDNRPTAVIFGLGNYAKTQIIPNIKNYLSLKRVHEIDPDQLLFFSDKTHIGLDTSPVPRDQTRYDAWFIAGYHHTHADLAITALKQDAYAVIEKPIFTSSDQYPKFVDAVLKNNKSKFFACFHKRYSELHTWAMQDLAKRNGQAVDMQCIVYEIPLPPLHWYNWPNSGSRLISNGCHWIDYFMFVNDYADVEDYRVWKPRGSDGGSDVCTYIRLNNQAYFTMSLTETGSQRLGVRDIIQLRWGPVTITMTDSASYESEDGNRTVRRRKVNPMHAYRNMYRKIAEKISKGEPGDTLESLSSSRLVLLLEDAARYK